MDRQRRRTLWYLAIFLAFVVGYTLVYDWGMAVYEKEESSLVESLQIVVETFTTTGYGSHAPWASPEMNLLVITMQFTGVILIFTTLPLFVVPAIESALEASVPTRAHDAEDHVVICEYTPRGETLVDELESQGVDYVIVESDREQALSLYEEDRSVIHGDPETTEALENARIGAASAVVADAADETNASIVLSVRELSDEVQTISFVQDPALEPYLHYAGADRVFAPRRLLGRGLANKVTSSVTSELGETVEIGTDFEIAELSIQEGSEICDRRIAESGLRERTGVSIIGIWNEGAFVASPPPDTVLDEGTVLLVAGRESQLERLKELSLAERRRHGKNKVLVVGYGEVGRTVSEELSHHDIDRVVLDKEEKEGVSVVGDVTDQEVLVAAGVRDASAVILALSDDTLTMFAALVVRELNPHVEIVARANEADNTSKMYRAGVDYVLALETVSGRMLASTILDEDVVALDKQIEIIRTEAPSLADRTLREADIRSRTGCTIIAVERDSTVRTDLDADFQLGADDRLVLAGTDDDISRFHRLVG